MVNPKKRLKAFSVETYTERGKYIFLTKAINGKDAVKQLITKSCDFKHILGNTESNNITIKIKHLKRRGKLND